MPQDNCCHNYQLYILFVRVLILTMIPITLICLNLIPVKVPKPSGRTTCSEQYHGSHSHSVPRNECKIENSVVVIGAGETCKIVLVGSKATLDLKSKEPFSVGFCEDGEYLYRYGKSHQKDVSVTLGRCDPTEFIFEIASERSNRIKVNISVSTRGIFSPFCSYLDFFTLVAVMVFYFCSVCVAIALLSDEVEDGQKPCYYNALLCFSGFFCLDRVFNSWFKNPQALPETELSIAPLSPDSVDV